MASSRTPPQEPPNFPATPEALIQRAKDFIARHDQGIQEINDIAANMEPETATFQNIILPIAFHENEYCSEAWYLQFHQDVSPDPTLREAARKVSEMIHTEKGSIGDFPDHMRVIQAISDELDPESQQFLQTRIPASSTGQHEDRIKEIDVRLDLIKAEFEANLGNDGSGIWLTEAEMSSVSEYVINKLKKGTERNEGRLFVEFASLAHSKIMRYAINPTTRKTTYIAEHIESFERERRTLDLM